MNPSLVIAYQLLAVGLDDVFTLHALNELV